ncbi:MAG: hypothetical protein KIY12_08400 [Thermoplasmata archaeon]|uniref:Uncharacterized protein n=1 Tax=Candidatus Sysuiplasma superficiale TaxID=2823368 RepID=A0A8J8CDU1_9ARCH|nr:hypothetical protein [Candidatus Sysuiplasma superficiale]MBX8644725.1 hypothetical protein [Candidatus Sysuiplasma superficiale]MCL4346404.1 hypothetical protein [Candidatus Thermoplasmatota archaeon]
MIISALIATLLFAVAFLSIYLSIYSGAVKSYHRGDLDGKGIRILRLGIVGHIVIFALIALTAFLI